MSTSTWHDRTIVIGHLQLIAREATLPGPDGGWLMFIIGTRDAGLREMAETVTNATSLERLVESVADASAFEALYVVEGMDQMNVSGKRLLSSRTGGGTIWNRYNLDNRTTTPYPDAKWTEAVAGHRTI